MHSYVGLFTVGPVLVCSGCFVQCVLSDCGKSRLEPLEFALVRIHNLAERSTKTALWLQSSLSIVAEAISRPSHMSHDESEDFRSGSMPLSSRIALSAVRYTDSGLQWRRRNRSRAPAMPSAYRGIFLSQVAVIFFMSFLAIMIRCISLSAACACSTSGQTGPSPKFRAVFLFACGVVLLFSTCVFIHDYTQKRKKERERKEFKKKERKKDRVQRGRCGLFHTTLEFLLACDPVGLSEIHAVWLVDVFAVFTEIVESSFLFFFFSFLFLGFRRPLYLMSRRAAVWATSRSSAPRRANSGNDGHGTAPCDPVVCGSECKLVLHLDLCAKPHRRNGMWQQLAGCRRRRCVENWLEGPKRLVSHASCFFQAPVIVSFHDQCQRCCHWGVFFQLSGIVAICREPF